MSAIRDARKRAHLTGEQLAERVGCSVAWIRTVERAPGLGSPELMARIAAELGLPATALLPGPRRKTLVF